MESIPVLAFGLAPAAEVLTRAFADYFVKLPASAEVLLGMVRQDSVDLAASRVWFADEQPAAVLLHAQRGTRARLAGMGIVPEARRRGLGRRAVEAWLADCRARGLRDAELEVIGANAPAIALYERAGFARVQRLAGWHHDGSSPPKSADAAAPADLRAVARQISRRDDALALPWQISGETVAQLGPPWTAWSLDGAAVAVSSLDAPTVVVRALVFPDAADPAPAALLLRAMVAAHPGRTWRAPAYFPESWSPAFAGAGFTPGPLDQWQMARRLD